MKAIELPPSTKKMIAMSPMKIKAQPIPMVIFRAASTDLVSINFPQYQPPIRLPAIPPRYEIQIVEPISAMLNPNFECKYNGIQPTNSHQMGSMKKLPMITPQDSRCFKIWTTLRPFSVVVLGSLTLLLETIRSSSSGMIQGCFSGVDLLMNNHGMTQRIPTTPMMMYVDLQP